MCRHHRTGHCGQNAAFVNIRTGDKVSSHRGFKVSKAVKARSSVYGILCTSLGRANRTGQSSRI